MIVILLFENPEKGGKAVDHKGIRSQFATISSFRSYFQDVLIQLEKLVAFRRGLEVKIIRLAKKSAPSRFSDGLE